MSFIRLDNMHSEYFVASAKLQIFAFAEKKNKIH